MMMMMIMMMMVVVVMRRNGIIDYVMLVISLYNARFGCIMVLQSLSYVGD